MSTLDAIFNVSASFSAKDVVGLKTINLGLDDQGSEIASLGRADFDALSAETTTLNIYASQKEIELDYRSLANADLTINISSQTASVETGGSSQGIQLINVKSLVIDQQSDFDADLFGALDLNDQTETLGIKNDGAEGHFEIGIGAFRSGIMGTSELRDVLIDFKSGGANLGAYDVFHDEYFLIDDATNLQNYTVLADDAAVYAGSVGQFGTAQDLETINIHASGSSELRQDAIFASDSTIAEMNVTGAAVNVEDMFFWLFFSIDANTYVVATYAEKIAQQTITTTGGGTVLLSDQVYTVEEQIFKGEGDIIFMGELDVAFEYKPGFVQKEAADASEHDGLRIFFDSVGYDVIYGTTEDDIINIWTFAHPFAASPYISVVYNDSGGNDIINLDNDAFIIVNDGDAGTDEIVYGVNSFQGNNLIYNVGSGNDYIELLPYSVFGFSSAHVDFGTRISGTLEFVNFDTAFFELSFDGLGDVTTVQSLAVAAGSTVASGKLDDNITYVLADGDTSVNGQAIADYTDLNDVAQFLSAVVYDTSATGDSAVFVVNNQGVTGVSGDDANTYFYLVEENGISSGIDSSEVTFLGMSSNLGNADITTTNIV